MTKDIAERLDDLRNRMVDIGHDHGFGPPWESWEDSSNAVAAAIDDIRAAAAKDLRVG